MSDDEIIEVGTPYAGWPIQRPGKADYEFGLDDGRLSAMLIDRLLEWARWFNRDFNEEIGWRTAQTEVAHRDEGRQLRDLVADELGPGYLVMLTSIYPRLRPGGHGEPDPR